jgi:alpha-L-fucosidase
MSTDNEADVYDPANERYYWEALPLETNRYKPYRNPDEKFNKMWLAKIQEVADRYHPDAVYFDSRAFIIDEEYRFQAAEYLYKKLKDAPITYKQEDFPQGIGVYDIECGRFAESKPYVWQTDDRLEDNITWCIVQEPRYKPAELVIHHLCDVVAKNGNLLLNVGPKTDGSFHPDALKELYAVGSWLKVNGEAIYGTRPFDVADEGPSKVKDENYDVDRINKQLVEGIAGNIRNGVFTHQDFRFTQKDGAVYAIAMGWPEDQKLSIRTLRLGGPVNEIHSVKLLGAEKPLNFKRTETALEVELPPERPCRYAYAIKVS